MFCLLVRRGYYFDSDTVLTNTAINLPSERPLAGRSNTELLSSGSYINVELDTVQLFLSRFSVA